MNQIETARILIRPYRPSDADSVWQVLRRKEIYDTTYAIPRNYPRERVDWWIQFVESARKNRTSYEFGMFDKHTGAYLGNCGVINVQPALRSGAISYFVNPDCWNLGYATEACSAMLAFAFNELGLCRVSGRCMAKNGASRKVMEKLGFLYEGTGRRELLKDGDFYAVDHLAILKEEWAGYLGF